MSSQVTDILVSSSCDTEDSMGDIVELEVPNIVHPDLRFAYLAFKEWYQINGWRIPVGTQPSFQPTRPCEAQYLKFIKHRDQQHGDRKNAEKGAVPEDAVHMAFMYINWLSQN